LLDRRTKTLLRLSHVAPDFGNVDVYPQEDYTTPLFTNLGVQQTSPYVEIDPTWLSALELDVTPAGNVGVLLTREQTVLGKGQRSTMFLVKSAAGTLDGLEASDTTRRLAPYAQLRPVNSWARLSTSTSCRTAATSTRRRRLKLYRPLRSAPLRRSDPAATTS
jgi:hypothetical protein